MKYILVIEHLAENYFGRMKELLENIGIYALTGFWRKVVQIGNVFIVDTNLEMFPEVFDELRKEGIPFSCFQIFEVQGTAPEIRVYSQFPGNEEYIDPVKHTILENARQGGKSEITHSAFNTLLTKFPEEDIHQMAERRLRKYEQMAERRLREYKEHCAADLSMEVGKGGIAVCPDEDAPVGSSTMPHKMNRESEITFDLTERKLYVSITGEKFVCDQTEPLLQEFVDKFTRVPNRLTDKFTPETKRDIRYKLNHGHSVYILKRNDNYYIIAQNKEILDKHFMTCGLVDDLPGDDELVYTWTDSKAELDILCDDSVVCDVIMPYHSSSYFQKSKKDSDPRFQVHENKLSPKLKTGFAHLDKECDDEAPIHVGIDAGANSFSTAVGLCIGKKIDGQKRLNGVSEKFSMAAYQKFMNDPLVTVEDWVKLSEKDKNFLVEQEINKETE